MEKQPVQIKIPKGVKRILLPDEQVLAAVKQSRLKAGITPDTIVVTNQRIIRYSPSALGLHKEIEDYRYEDMANFKISEGIMFATITIKHRFMSEELILDNLPKGSMETISKAVEENIRRVRSGIVSQPTSQSENALEVLKLRFARGEITREQFEEMKRFLD
jgi:hypothetical protein